MAQIRHSKMSAIFMIYVSLSSWVFLPLSNALKIVKKPFKQLLYDYGVLITNNLETHKETHE